MSCGVGHRHGSDSELLWLWCRPVARAPIGPLVWELPYAMGVALKKSKGKKARETIMKFAHQLIILSQTISLMQAMLFHSILPTLELLLRSSHHGLVIMNPTSIYEDMGLISGLAHWVKDPILP